MSKKALITGATGFVGSNLARGLLCAGWQVDIIVRPSSNLKLLEEISEQLNVYEYACEINTLIDVMAQSKPDIVFHVASLFLSDHRSDQVDTLIQSNILFGAQLLEAMSIVGVHNIVNTSTSWEHYENKDYSPVNLYAATKKAFQDVLQYYVEAKGFKVVTLKLFDTYGPNDPRPKLINLLIRASRTGEPLSISPGDQKINLTYIDDVVSAYITAAKRLSTGIVDGIEEFGVFSDNTVSIKDFVTIFSNAVDAKLIIHWGGRGYRNREVMTPWNAANRLPSWIATVDLPEGIRRIW